jgi:hypothetical protein
MTTTDHPQHPREVQPGPEQRSPGCTGSPERIAILLALAAQPVGLQVRRLQTAANSVRALDEALTVGETRRILRMLVQAERISVLATIADDPVYYAPAARAAASLRSAAEQARRLASMMRDPAALVD